MAFVDKLLDAAVTNGDQSNFSRYEERLDGDEEQNNQQLQNLMTLVLD